MHYDSFIASNSGGLRDQIYMAGAWAFLKVSLERGTASVRLHSRRPCLHSCLLTGQGGVFDPHQVLGPYVCPTVGAYWLLATCGIGLALIPHNLSVPKGLTRARCETLGQLSQDAPRDDVGATALYQATCKPVIHDRK